jgi:hypothetical protein
MVLEEIETMLKLETITLYVIKKVNTNRAQNVVDWQLEGVSAKKREKVKSENVRNARIHS